MSTWRGCAAMLSMYADFAFPTNAHSARNCISAIQKRLVHRNANVQLYSLTLSDALAKNSGLPAHRELASRNFTQTLARVVADRNTHQSVRTRAVSVLKEWANDFDDGGDGSLGLVKETVEQLRQQGFTAEADRPKREEAPTEPSSEQLRKEDEELRRVLELSMQDQGGRGAAYGGSASSAPGESAAAATSSSSSSRPPGSATAALLDKSLPNPNAGDQSSASRPQQQQAQASPAPPAAAAATPAPSRPSRVRGLYDFSPTEAGELPFSKGDVIRVLDSVYEHWWRGELRGEVGIFPVNYVEVLPDPTPEEIRREAEQEARIFQQAGDIDRLLAKLRQLEAAPGGANLAEDEELQDLYQSSLAMRPRIVRLIDRYSGKVQELRALNDKFVRARGTFDAMMERSMAVHQPGQNASAYLGVRPEYGYAGQQPQGQPQYQQQPQQGHGQGSQDSYHSQQQAWQQPQQPQQQQQSPPQQQTAPPQDPQAYAQWYHHQQQQQHQQAPQQHQQPQGGYPAQYPQQHEAAPQHHQQQQQQQQPQAEEEKQRLYEQARREAEAYHAAYGNHNAYQGASGSAAGGAAMAAAPGGGM